MSANSEWGDPIHSYSRAEAIADGTLCDASHAAHLLGYDKRVPVAVTAAVYAYCAAGRDIYDRGARLVSVLDAARQAILAAHSRDTEADRTDFLHPGFVDFGLHVEIGPGDAGEPVLTIGLPWDF